MITLQDNLNNKKEEVNKVDKTNKKEDKSTWAIGGGVLIGVGAGIFYIRTYPLGIAAFTLIGLGLGLIVASIISRK